MLKTPSRPKEWPALFTGELNGSEWPVHASIRAAWAAPKTMKLVQYGLDALMIKRLGWYPAII